MGNTVQTPRKIDLLADIDSALEKVKAITFLMAFAAKEGSFQCGDEMDWAQQVVGGLINDASSAVEQLAKIGEGSARTNA